MIGASGLTAREPPNARTTLRIYWPKTVRRQRWRALEVAIMDLWPDAPGFLSHRGERRYGRAMHRARKKARIRRASANIAADFDG